MNEAASSPNNGQQQISVDAGYKLAVEHFNAQQFAEADQLCTAILQVAPQHSDAINLLGVIEQKNDRHDLAVQQFQKAIQINGNNALFHYNLGTSLYPLGQIEAVVEAQTRAIALQPQYAEAYSSLGNALTELGRLDEAIDCLQKSIAINPNIAEAYNNLAIANKAQGRLVEAQQYLQKAILINPNFIISYNNLGILLYEQDQLEEAVEVLQQAIENSPNYSGSYSNLGIVFHKLGKLQEAEVNIKKSLSIKPDFAQAYSNLGYLLAEKGEFEEAIANCEKAISINPAVTRFHDNLKRCKKELLNSYIANIGQSYQKVKLDVNQLISTKQKSTPIKLNLLFCPFVDPITPPSGIASLKGYLDKYGDADVDCIDLNLEFYKTLASYECNLDVKPIADAKKLFANSDDMFGDIDLYRDSAAKLFYALDGYTDSIQYSLSKDEPNFKQIIIEHLLPLALKGKPDIVGFSLLLEGQLLFSLLLAQEIKKADPNIIVLFGGAATLSLYKQIKKCPYVDFIFTDAGELSLNELLISIKNGKLNNDIPGITFYSQGIFTKNSAAPSDLNHGAYPDFSDLNLDRYFTDQAVVPILSSKGCFWRRCSFCEEGSINLYSTAKVDRVVNEIEHHVTQGYRYFQFVDEMISPKRLRMLSKEIISRNLKVYFYATLRPSADFNKETMEMMFAAGFRYVIWGVESCNSRVLKLVNKGTTVESIQNTLKFSKNAGLRNHIFIIIGYPSEKPHELYETMEFIYNNIDNIHLVHSGPFHLCEGTEIHTNPEKFDIEIKQGANDNGSITPVYKVDTTAYKAEEYFKYYLDTFIDKVPDNYSFARFRDHALIYYAKFPIDNSEDRKKKVPKPIPARIN
ncbi:MAG: tetratricopeptide repeat protein [Magnetococcales bacterium]|nr:tetratricopeptide repeat protein [Magnetococcales bacterium]